MSQLLELSKPFPPLLVKSAPKGKFGDYVGHSTVNERLLSALGPFSYSIDHLIYDDGMVTGCLATLTATVDGNTVSVTEVGDVENPSQKGTNGARAKDASSDALKRCAMRLGLGLHLWSGRDYFLDKQLAKLEGEVDAG